MSDVEDKEVETKEMSADAKVYELGYLLVPTIKEEEVPAEYGNIKNLIGSFGGLVIADEMPKVIPLAYPMTKVVANVRSKFTTAYFGWVKFTMNGAEVLELKKKLDLDPKFVRFLIIKTVKENTVAAKRFVRGDTMHRRGPAVKRSTEDKDAVLINKEEIDKEIDAMVAV